MPKKIDITGQRFGRLLVVDIAKNRISSGGHQRTMWLCKCDCGKELDVATNSIMKGDAKSCGCLHREISVLSNSTHKMCGTGTYRSWQAMMNRCMNKSSHAYPHYGGRGISVCDKWRLFENFLADMGERQKETSIDRFPDNNGNYEPGNCRWATSSEQSRNRRNSVFIKFGGRNQCVADWARDIGISAATLMYRLDKWPLEAALTKRKQK